MKINTLNKKFEFQAAFKSNVVFVSNLFVAYCLHFENDNVQTRFGFVIRKKVGNAVVRNKIRRRLKSSIYTKLSCKLPLYIVIVARSKIAEADFQAISDEVKKMYTFATKTFSTNIPISQKEHPKTT